MQMVRIWLTAACLKICDRTIKSVPQEAFDLLYSQGLKHRFFKAASRLLHQPIWQTIRQFIILLFNELTLLSAYA
jgi:hypothetical protein